MSALRQNTIEVIIMLWCCLHWMLRGVTNRAVAITAISQYRAIDEHNRRGMQQPQQPRYFLFVSVRLLPSRFILSAYVLNISNDNNVYHADLYRGSVNLHLTSPNRQRMRERSTERVRLPESVLQAESCIFVKTGCHVQGKRNLS